MNYEISIISYKRHKELPLKSLKFLKENNVPISLIRIFLQDEEELELYKETCGEEYNYHIHHQKGILATRNYQQDYYHNHTNLEHVVMMDDDVKSITKLGKPLDVSLTKILEYFATETVKRGAHLWGINALKNPYFMKDRISTNFKYCIGAFKGVILDRKNDVILCDIDVYEDIQFTCEFFIQDGAVVRFDAYGIDTEYFSKGGICESLGGKQIRLEKMLEHSVYMMDRYGDMVKKVNKPWGTDIKINWRFTKEDLN
jgi:hypothetical protein